MVREKPEAPVLSSGLHKMCTHFPSRLCLRLHYTKTGMGSMMPGLEGGEWIFDSVYGFHGCQHQSWQYQTWLLYLPLSKISSLKVPVLNA